MIYERVVIPIEVRCGIGDAAGSNRVLYSSLPSLGGVVFHEFIVEETPGGGLAVEFRHGDLIGIEFQGACELS